MKYVIVLGDGMADEPIKELGNKTPLEAANTPMMDELASKGEVGLAFTIPEGMKPGSDTANLAVLGYDPKVYYSGRSPLEALSIGVPMKEKDISFRVNIVTISEEDFSDEDFGKRTIIDHSSGEITTTESKILLQAVLDELKEKNLYQDLSFYPGTGYRHCLIWENGKEFDLAIPHDNLDKTISTLLPEEFIKETGEDSDEKIKEMAKDFTDIMKISYKVLNHHPINEKRRSEGKKVANCFWFWGAGTKPNLAPFFKKTNKKGTMISAVDLLKGIGIGAMMEVPSVEGANGTLDTNYEGKAQKALDLLIKEDFDFAYVHVEAADEMSHQGSFERKIKAIEYIDDRVIKRIYDELKSKKIEFRMLVMPDHPTPVALRTHTSDAVPYLIYDSRNEKGSGLKYSEKEAAKSNIVINPGYKLIEKLLEDKKC